MQNWCVHTHPDFVLHLYRLVVTQRCEVFFIENKQTPLREASIQTCVIFCLSCCSLLSVCAFLWRVHTDPRGLGQSSGTADQS